MGHRVVAVVVTWNRAPLLERILRHHPAVARDWARVVDEDESYDDEADW